MTAIPQSGASKLISDRIAGPLREVASRQWKLIAARALLRALLVLLTVVLAGALLLGFLPGLPVWLRMVVAAFTWATVIAGAAYCLRPALRRRSLSDAAFVVERRVPGLHERLSSAVELTGEHDVFAGSPLLLRHLARQAETDAAAVRAQEILPADAVNRQALWLVPALLLWVALALLFPRPLFAGLYRVVMPWHGQLPALLTDVSVIPGDVTIAEGDTLEIRANVRGHSSRDGKSGRALLLTRADDAGRIVSRDLAAAAPGAFTATLTDLRQTVSYRVSADGGDSPWYTATVLPRPAVARLDLHYEYPSYTGIDPKTHEDSDGAINAIQGTEVTLTIHVTDALDLAEGKSRVAITEGSRSRDANFKPVDGKLNAYEARLTVFNSGSYRLRLVNRHGLSNRDDQTRPIVVEMDQPPKVAIVAPDSEVSVRADDDVPVGFAASDDFGVAKLQAVVRVDDKSEEVIDVDVSRAADPRRIDSAWTLVVPAHLARAGVSEAKAITYWLRVADNRDPDPQSAESAKQTLKIDNGQPLAYRTRVEQQYAKDLMQAIDHAMQKLQQSEGPVNSLKDIDPNRPMNPDEKNRAVEQRERLAKASEELAAAAESNLRDAFSAVAASAKEIAETPIQGAAENVARSLLSAEQPEPRARAATEASGQIADSRKQLEELKKKVEARSKELQTARELEKIAQRQAELALAQPARRDKPENAEQKSEQEKLREKSRQQQRELAQRLQRAINESEPLRDLKSAEQAIRLRELLDRVEKIQKDGAPLKEQLAKQDETARLQQQAEDLAAKQQELNEAIENFAESRRSPLRRADAHAPARNHQAGIVDRLRQNEPQQAQDMQRQSAEQLRQAAKQLQERGRSRELRPDAPEQYAIGLSEQAVQAARHAAERAKDAAEQLRRAKESKDAGQLAEAEKAVDESAQALTDQSRAAAESVREAASSGDATAVKEAAEANHSAEAAQSATEAARQAARRSDPPETARKFEEAGKQLAKAREKALAATRADLLAAQQAAAHSASEQAKGLAERQAALADASKETARALEQARRDQQSPQDVANRHNQLKDQTQEAHKQADQLEQLARSTHPALADRAAAAETLLQEAAASEAQAAQAEQAVAQAEQQSAQALQQAAQAGQQGATLDREADESAAQADEQQRMAAAAQKHAADAQARKDEGAAESAKRQAAQATQAAAEHQKQVESRRQQSASAEKQQADALKQSDAARQATASARGQASEHQAKADEALARAEDVLRNVDRMTADASGRARPAPSKESSSPQPAQPDASQPAEAQASADASSDSTTETARPQAGSPSPPPLTRDGAMRQAAQGAQEAVQAQEQALNHNADPGAIRQAAAALQQAAAAMSAATASSESSESSVAAADEQVETGGDARNARETAASAAASSRSPDSRTGRGTGAGSHDGRPQSVQELGISAGDWARLGPLTRQELLNAAQQTGPPAYREMIKNYYVKIAKLGRQKPQ